MRAPCNRRDMELIPLLGQNIHRPQHIRAKSRRPPWRSAIRTARSRQSFRRLIHIIKSSRIITPTRDMVIGKFYIRIGQ